MSMKIDYGPLKSLFESEDITEIMVNRWNKVFVEHKGMIVETSVRFVDERQYQEFLYSIVSFDKKNIASAFSFDGLLPQGHRYNLTLPPMAPQGAVLTVRKFRAQNFRIEDLVQSDFLSENAAHFLKLAVQSRLNIVISGGTGSGKTSFLNCLGSVIPDEERIVSIEDVAELRLDHPNWLSLQSVNEGSKKISARDCLVNSLRMRPDRIIVGECRKDETFEMLQAMNTGHDGSLTTVHANSPNDCLSRLESLVSLAGTDLSQKFLRQQIASSIHLIVQIRRLSQGKREVSEITELTGMQGDVISRASIFQRSKQGQLSAIGYVPRKLAQINSESMLLPASFFEAGASGTKSKKSA